jgi:hypothetical protein
VPGQLSHDGTVRVWDLAGTAAPRVLTGHDGRATAVAVSADGRTAVSGGRDPDGAGVGPGWRPGAGSLAGRRRCTGRCLRYRRHRCWWHRRAGARAPAERTCNGIRLRATFRPLRKASHRKSWGLMVRRF